MPHLYQQLVHFVAHDCGWPIEAQAQGSGLDPATIRRWFNGTSAPRLGNLSSWIEWVCDESETALFNPFGPKAGRWVRGRTADVLSIAPGWSPFAILGEQGRWALVCMWRGQVEEVEFGPWPRGWSDDELLNSLSANVRLLCQGRGLHRSLSGHERRSLEMMRLPTESDFERLSR